MRRRAGARTSWLSLLVPYALVGLVVVLVSMLLRRVGMSHRAVGTFVRILAGPFGYVALLRPFDGLVDRVQRWRWWRRLSAGIGWCVGILRRFATVLWLSLAAAGYGLLAWLGEWTPWQCLAGAATALALALLHRVRGLAEPAGARRKSRRRLGVWAWSSFLVGRPRAQEGVTPSGHRHPARIRWRGAMAAGFAVLVGSIAWVGCAQWDPWRSLATLLVLADGSLLVALGVLLRQARSASRHPHAPLAIAPQGECGEYRPPTLHASSADRAAQRKPLPCPRS